MSVLSVLYIFVSIHSEPSNIGKQTGVLLVSLIKRPLSQRVENQAGSDSDQSDFLVWSHDRSKVNARNTYTMAFLTIGNIIKFGIADFEMITNSPIRNVQLHVAGYFFYYLEIQVIILRFVF